MCCFWYQYLSAFAAECRHDLHGILCVCTVFVVRFALLINPKNKPKTSPLISPSIFQKYVDLLFLLFSSYTQICLTQTCFEERHFPVWNLLSLVAKSLTHFHVYPLIKIHLFSPTRHKTLPKASRANTKSREAFTHSLLIHFSPLQISPYSSSIILW